MYLRDGIVVDRDVLLKDNSDGHERYKIRQSCGRHFDDFNQLQSQFRSLTRENFRKIDSIEIAPGVSVQDVMTVMAVISNQNNPIIHEPIFQTARLLMKISDIANECESAMYACNRFVSQTHRNRLEDTFKRISTNYINERDAKGKEEDEEEGLEDEYDDYGEDIYESESEVESDDDFDHPPRYVPSNPSYIPKKGFY